MDFKGTLTVVVPVYNGSKSLESLCAGIFETAAELFEDCEIILVDDKSTDGSYGIMKALRQGDRRIKLVKLRRNAGQQSATFCGIQFAEGDFIATFDDDLQHPPELLRRMKAEIENGAELVFAVGNRRSKEFYRRLGSRLTYLLFNRMLKRKEPVRISSCRMFTKRLRDRVEEGDKQFVYVSAELLKAADRVQWFLFDQGNRIHGQSNYTFFKLAGTFLKLLLYYSDVPWIKRFRTGGKPYEIEETDMEGRDAL